MPPAKFRISFPFLGLVLTPFPSQIAINLGNLNLNLILINSFACKAKSKIEKKKKLPLPRMHYLNIIESYNRLRRAD